MAENMENEELESGHLLNMESTHYMNNILDSISHQSSNQKKYFLLRQKTEQTQQANERLINRLYYAKVILKLHKRERRFLMNRLDELGDNFRDVQVPAMWDGAPDMDDIVREIDKATSALAKPTTSSSEAAKAPSAVCKPPKKPVHPFVLFSEKNSSMVQETYKLVNEHEKDLNAQELSRVLAEKWQYLPPDEKKVYQDLHDRDKQRYDKEMKEYLEYIKNSSFIRPVKKEEGTDNLSIKKEPV